MAMGKLSLREIAEQAVSAHRSADEEFALIKERIDAVYKMVLSKKFRLRASGHPEERKHFVFCFDRRRWNACLALVTADEAQTEECVGYEAIVPEWKDFLGFYEKDGEDNLIHHVDFTDTVPIFNLYRGATLVIRVLGTGYALVKYPGAEDTLTECDTLEGLEKALQPYLAR